MLRLQRFMKKYIFYTLISALLFIGWHQASKIELQGLPENAEALAINTSSCGDSKQCTFTNASEHSCQDYHTFIDFNQISKISDCILGGLSFTRSSAPCKSLKFNPISTIVHVLSSLNSELIVNKYRNLASTLSDYKKTKIYYIYTLSHIII